MSWDPGRSTSGSLSKKSFVRSVESGTAMAESFFWEAEGLELQATNASAINRNVTGLVIIWFNGLVSICKTNHVD
jgi:hypothetical protein